MAKEILLMTKKSVVRLPDKAAEKVEEYAKERGLAFATAVRCMIIDHLKETCPNPKGKSPDRNKPRTSKKKRTVNPCH